MRRAGLEHLWERLPYLWGLTREWVRCGTYPIRGQARSHGLVLVRLSGVCLSPAGQVLQSVVFYLGWNISLIVGAGLPANGVD
mgnify:CR=1 FL=1